ncbi:MAG TPA: hypothetical protein VNL71_23560 [Chloroflexota bacterium]|nr:hypothetical protein [Chloroflexota bacterium]
MSGRFSAESFRCTEGDPWDANPRLPFRLSPDYELTLTNLGYCPPLPHQ